jgi:hypothetical protein
MTEQKFTEAELLAGAARFYAAGSPETGDMLTQAARAVAEVGAWEQAVREFMDPEKRGPTFNNCASRLADRVATILREKKEKQGGN